MPLTFSSPVFLALATLLAAWVAWRGDRQSTPVSGWHGLSLLPIWAVPWIAPLGEKAWLAAMGILLGGGLAYAAERFGLASERRWSLWLPLAWAVVWLNPTLSSYLWLGFALGWSLLTLSLALSGTSRKGFPALVQGVMLVAASIWGYQQHHAFSLGGSLPWVAGSLVLASRLHPWPWLAAPVAGGALAGVMALAYGPIGLHLVLAVVLGMAPALLLRWQKDRIDQSDGRLVFMLGVGGLLLLAARLWGMEGVSYLGLGLLFGEGVLVESALLLFAGRVLLQLFLLRTGAAVLGIDVTHPYAYATLGLGMVLAFGMRSRAWPAPVAAGGAAGAIALVPLIGFWFHLEALSSLLAVLVLMGFGLSATRLNDTLAPWVVGSLAAALVAAPWVLKVANEPRMTRMIWLMAIVVGVWLCTLLLIWKTPRPSPN